MTRDHNVCIVNEKRFPAGVPRGRTRWTVCAMLFAATTINYMDRQVIGILKPTLEHSIRMTELDYGYIVDSFQIAYALGLLATGRFIDKVGTRAGYVMVMAIWSLSAMAHALVNSVVGFGIARFCLGIGESGNFPAAIKTVTEWFPQSERSLATGIFNSGSNVGAVLAPLLVPWVTIRYGWPAAFLVTGAFGSVWIPFWFRTYKRPTDESTLALAQRSYPDQEGEGEWAARMPWLELLRRRQTWAFATAKLLTDPIWWFYLFWMPSYFSQKFHLDLSHLGLPLVIVYNASTLGSIGGGWLPANFRRLGCSYSTGRLAAMLVCACAVVPILIANYVHSEWEAIALFSLATGAHCGWSANLFTTVSDMFPCSAVGSVTGIGGMAGSVGGILLATYAGYILQLTHSYTSLFAIASGAYLLAFLLLVLLAPGLKKAQ